MNMWTPQFLTFNQSHFFPLTLAKSSPEDKLLNLSQNWPAGWTERSDGAVGKERLETFYHAKIIPATRPET